VRDVEHVPVLLEEILGFLHGLPGGTFVDCTVGLGGHAQAILDRISPSGGLIAMDADEDALREARSNLAPYEDKVMYVRANYRKLSDTLQRLGVRDVAGIFLDLGMSSAQVENPSKGFSFSRGGPLDMRYDRRQPLTAADIANGYPEKELVKILREFGEEKAARRIASRIVHRRGQSPISSTDELAELVVSATRPRRTRIHPATKTFQALRVAVNDELGSLSEALPQAIAVLRPGGRLIVLSYHSLEDRIVKQTFREFEKGCICPPSFPVCQCGRLPEVNILTKKPIRPSLAEIRRNPRSRSARMRVCEKRKKIRNLRREGEEEAPSERRIHRQVVYSRLSGDHRGGSVRLAKEPRDHPRIRHYRDQKAHSGRGGGRTETSSEVGPALYDSVPAEESAGQRAGSRGGSASAANYAGDSPSSGGDAGDPESHSQPPCGAGVHGQAIGRGAAPREYRFAAETLR
jgi:16S rRNA (cytosine1402-N4)-methyltransferase